MRDSREDYGLCTMSTRILLVEDDADLCAAMAAALEADGHAIGTADDAAQALDALAETPFDLVLLDIALGDGPDGIEVCRRLRRVDTDVYVMMLTARGQEADIVLALEAGADDYVVKPVGIAELRSRVRAALRRVRGPADRHADGVLRHAGMLLDPAARVLRVAGNTVATTRSELALVEALMRAGGAVRSRPELLEVIYGDHAYRDPRGVDVHVHHLREKLAAAGGDPAWIATVRGAGYRLA